MQRLNIPLSQHTKTTRLHRRVVWLFVFWMLICAFIAWRASEIWFNRDSILSAAPDETILALQFKLTKKTLPFIEKILADVPLISDRSFDIHDLQAMTSGEIALFVTQAGERAVAVRAKKPQLPLELLNAHSIRFQEIGNDFILLSSNIMPVGGISSSIRHPFFPSVQKTWLGRVVLPDENRAGSIFYEKNQLSVDFRAKNETSDISRMLPASVLGFTAQGKNFSPIENSGFYTNELLQKLADSSVQSWTTLINTNDQGQLEILLALKTKDFSQSDLIQTLQFMGAFASPALFEKSLADGTSMKEIVIEPEFVTVSQVSVNNQNAYQVTNQDQTTIFGALFEDSVFFFTNSSLFDLFIANEQKAQSCSGNTLQIQPQLFLSQIPTKVYSPENFMLQTFFSHFSAISIETKKYSNKLSFCLT